MSCLYGMGIVVIVGEIKLFLETCFLYSSNSLFFLSAFSFITDQ